MTSRSSGKMFIRSLPGQMGGFPVVCGVAADDMSDCRERNIIAHRHDPIGRDAVQNGLARLDTARRRLIEIEGLRIELGSEREGPLPFDAQPPGTERLPHCKIFQVALAQLIHDSTPARRWFRAGAMNPLLVSISLTIACSSRLAGVATSSISPRRTMKPFR